MNWSAGGCTSGWALVAVFLEVKREDVLGTLVMIAASGKSKRTNSIDCVPFYFRLLAS